MESRHNIPELQLASQPASAAKLGFDKIFGRTRSVVGTCVNYKSAILHNFCQFDFIAIINWKLSDKLIDSQVSDEVVEIFGTDGWRDKWAKRRKNDSKKSSQIKKIFVHSLDFTDI